MTTPKSITVTLRWPPSINGYWRSIIRGKYASQIISEDGRAFRSSVELVFALCPHKVKFHGPVEVEIVLRRNDKRRWDVDNHAKAICDSFTHVGIWRDDSQIDVLTIRRGPKSDTVSHAIVTITELVAT
jgi:crossover junction endodeoxyribonuclease RusA